MYPARWWLQFMTMIGQQKRAGLYVQVFMHASVCTLLNDTALDCLTHRYRTTAATPWMTLESECSDWQDLQFVLSVWPVERLYLEWRISICMLDSVHGLNAYRVMWSRSLLFDSPNQLYVDTSVAPVSECAYWKCEEVFFCRVGYQLFPSIFCWCSDKVQLCSIGLTITNFTIFSW